MKKTNLWLLLTLFILLLAACGNDGVYNEETNRESVKRKKALKDSIRKTEKMRRDTIKFQNGFSHGVTDFGQLAISCSQLFFHFFP